MENGRVRVLIADEQSLFREALCLGLRREVRLEVVGQARDGHQAIAEAERSAPDVAVLDSNLPNPDGISVIPILRGRVPGCRVLIMSGQEDQRTLLDALEAGASGYLPKDRPLHELVDATLAISRGETVVPRSMLGPLIERLLRRRRGQDDAVRRVSKLSRRERQVLGLLAQGADNDVISQQLVISPQTARTHVQNILGKLSVHSRLEAAAFARQSGILAELQAEVEV
ncbi:MAG TPA: response regulator transcription factor [Actinomycetota bacterium]